MKKRLLTLLWLLCPLLFIAGAYADFTVYVKVNTTEKVNLHYWNIPNVSGTSWPGMQMTKTTKHNYVTDTDDEVYTYTITGTDATSINGIFNLGSGSPQTANLTLVNGNVYEWDKTNQGSATNINANYVQSASDFTVKFKYANWSNVYAYVWSGDGESAVAPKPWPGEELTKSGDAYTYTYTGLSAPEKIIFNNGGSSQTPDLTFVDGKTYEHIYTLVGNSKVLFGTVWSVDLPANDMTETSDGAWTWTKENVELEAGNIEYKVTYGHDGWTISYGADGAYNGSNATLNIGESGTYNVTFTFNPSTPSLTAEATLVSATPTETYTATFVNTGDWDAVYAYPYNAGGDIDGKSWPGIELTSNGTQKDGHDVYTFSADLTAAPTNIIFNNNAGTQTEDFVFEEGKEYSYPVTYFPSSYTISGELTGGWNINHDNDMTDNGDGTWTLVIDSFTAEAHGYSYKVYDGSATNETREDEGIWQIPASGNNVYGFTEAGDYKLTFTLTPAEYKLELAAEKLNAGIVAPEKVQIVGDFTKWTVEAVTLTGENYVYTYELDLTNDDQDQLFDLLVNDGGSSAEGWIHYNDFTTIDAPEDWLEASYDTKLNNSKTGYKKYLITFTWTPSDNPYTGWALKVEGTEERTAPIEYVYTYYVTGVAALVGENWDRIKMDEDTNGNHTLTITGLSLNAGTEYAYKVVATNDKNSHELWLPDGMGNDAIVKVDEDGIYTITWTLYPEQIGTTDYPYDYTATKTGDIVQPDKDKIVYYVDMQAWEPSAHIWNAESALTPDWTTGEYERTLSAFGNNYNVNKYEFAGEPTSIMFQGENNSQKTSDLPFVNGATYGNDGDTPNGVFMFTDDEYQFKPTENINVTANAKYVRQFTVGQPCTVVLPFALGADKVGENAEAGQVGVFYRVTAIADGNLNGNTEVPAPYQPYVFIPTVEYPFAFVGVGQFPAVPETKNYAVNGGDAFFEFVTTTTTVTSDNEWTYYGWDKDTHQFTKAAVGLANPFRSYIKIKTSALESLGLSAKESIGLNFIDGGEGGETTGIRNLRAAIENGTATVYDLQGRRVDNPSMRGIYIVNGKKYVVK